MVFFAICACGTSLSAAQPIAAPEGMHFVTGATFRMGSDTGELERIREMTGLETVAPLLAEVPSRTVTIADFFMDSHSVTNRQFARFTAAVPSWSKALADPALHNGRYLEHWIDGMPPDRLLDHPVTFVSWQSAVAYCNWAGKRLPSEAEYEWASQNGATRTEYPWGNQPPTDDIVSWGGNGVDGTVPVGSYPPNARGLYDMSGNIWHFTSDPWLGTYADMRNASVEPAEAAADPSIRRVVRGGSWGANAANLRIRYRDSHRPFDAREMVGFRCAKSIDP